MWSIHPNQIRPISPPSRPTGRGRDRGRDPADRAGSRLGPDRAPRALQDRASYRYHWHVLERASRTGRVLPEPVRAAFFPRLARAAAGAAAEA
jgi:citrate lyase subunit beta/citryl-CoA lyase